MTDYPKEIKSFYMKQNDDGKTVRAMDVLFPKIGEIIMIILNNGTANVLSGTISGTITNNTGGTFVVDGAMLINSTSAFANANIMNLTTGVLELTATRAAGASSTNIIANTGTVNVGSNFIVNLVGSAVDSSGTVIYTIISGGTITGWDSLTVANFKNRGVDIDANTRINLSVNGQVIFFQNVATTLYWNSADGSGTWSDSDSSWRKIDGTSSTVGWSFKDGDTVVFDGKYQAVSGTTNTTTTNQSSPVAELVGTINSGRIHVGGLNGNGESISLTVQSADANSAVINANDSIYIYNGSELVIGEKTSIVNKETIVNMGTLTINSQESKPLDNSNGTIRNEGTLNIYENATIEGVLHNGFVNAGTTTAGTINIADNKKLTISEEFYSVAGSTINLNGSGTITLEGEFVVNGTTNIVSANASAGEFNIDGANATLTLNSNIINSSTINLVNGTMYITATDSSKGSNIIENSGTVSVSAGFIFDFLGGDVDYTGSTVYTIISGGNIVDWNTLTWDNFRENGINLSHAVNIDSTEDGKVSFFIDYRYWNALNGNGTWDIANTQTGEQNIKTM